MLIQSISMLIFIPVIILLSLIMLYNSLFLSIELPLTVFNSINIPISFLLDWFSLAFLATVMMISSMILLFSVDYIPKTEHYKFSLIMLSFVLSMALLIISDNIIFLLLGWDGLGLTSYILVIYYQNASSSASGSITIFSNRMGDILIILTISFMFSLMNWNLSFNENFSMLFIIMLVLAACSKSAQFPFSAWLPAAMAAPTPISALVHSSTLVTAGVYLLIRVMGYPHPISMMILLILSSATALYASMSANWEQDMKKIIALSTLSQIAMMMFAIAIGAINLAFFHLIIHALFKSMMFLCAGVIIHSSSYQDMRSMGSMMNNSPIISSSLGISLFALMGLPFMSGFFSKDPIIESIMNSKLFSLLTSLMIISIGMTAMYSLRMILFSLKFYIKSKSDMPHHPSNMMESPIISMSLFSVIMGLIMSWLSNPEQIFILPTTMKISMLILLLSGTLLSLSMSFSSKTFIILGETSISLWFLHFIFTNLVNPMTKFMNLFMNNDKNWQESYGPYNMYNQISSSSITPEYFLLLPLFILLMFSIIIILSFIMM